MTNIPNSVTQSSASNFTVAMICTGITEGILVEAIPTSDLMLRRFFPGAYIHSEENGMVYFTVRTGTTGVLTLEGVTLISVPTRGAYCAIQADKLASQYEALKYAL